jgi:hypothetical protein
MANGRNYPKAFLYIVYFKAFLNVRKEAKSLKNQMLQDFRIKNFTEIQPFENINLFVKFILQFEYIFTLKVIFCHFIFFS